MLSVNRRSYIEACAQWGVRGGAGEGVSMSVNNIIERMLIEARPSKDLLKYRCTDFLNTWSPRTAASGRM